MRADRRFALIVGLFVGLGPAAAAGAARPAAVVPLLVVNLEAPEVDAVGAALARALTHTGAGPVLGGRAVRRRLPDSGLAPDCTARPECVQDVRQRLEADALVFVIVSRVGQQIQIDPTVVIDGAPGPRAAVRAARAQFDDLEWISSQVSSWLPTRPQATPSPPVPSRAQEAPSAPPSTSWVSPGWATWGAAGLGVAALAVGTGLGLSARALERDLEDRGCETQQCPAADIDQLSGRARLADVAFVAGGVALAAAVVLYLTVDEGPTTVSVAAGPGGAFVTGRF